MYYTQTIEFCTEEGWSIAAQFTLVMIITICIMSTTAVNQIHHTDYAIIMQQGSLSTISANLESTIHEGYSKYSSQITAYILHYLCLIQPLAA